MAKVLLEKPAIMKTLLLFIGENEKFAPNQISSILPVIPGTHNLKEGNFVGSILECEFAYENDFTLIRLSDDLETISISGVVDASLKIALEIQKRYPKPIRLIDSQIYGLTALAVAICCCALAL